MSRGVFYTDEEDNRLREVCKDNEGDQLITLARKAQKYGICTERDERALAQHISKLLAPEATTEEGNDEVDPKAAFWESVAHHYEEKYFDLRTVILWKAKLYKGVNHNSLTLDYKAILKWFWQNDPEGISAAIETLEYFDEMGGANA